MIDVDSGNTLGFEEDIPSPREKMPPFHGLKGVSLPKTMVSFGAVEYEWGKVFDTFLVNQWGGVLSEYNTVTVIPQNYPMIGCCYHFWV